MPKKEKPFVEERENPFIDEKKNYLPKKGRTISKRAIFF